MHAAKKTSFQHILQHRDRVLWRRRTGGENRIQLIGSFIMKPMCVAGEYIYRFADRALSTKKNKNSK